MKLNFKLNFKNEINYEEIDEIIKDLDVKIELNHENLCLELDNINEMKTKFLQNHLNFKNEPWIVIYKEFFKENVGEFKELKKFPQYFCSINVSNAHVERIFSILLHKKNKIKNRISNELLKSELIIKNNLDMESNEFYNMFGTNK